jgi:hypothetical protein
VSEKDNLIQFLTHIWGEEAGTVFLATKPGPDLFKVERPQRWPLNENNVVQFILAANASRDVYYTPGIFVDTATGKSKEFGRHAKCLWVDVDGYKDGQDAPQAALELIRKTGLIPEPTYRLQSSFESAQHWYWILDEYTPMEVFESINRRLAYWLKADTACWDISHVMRPPFTVNHKYEQRPPVDIIAYNSQIYSIDQFNDLPPVRDQIKEIIEFGDIPDIENVMMQYPWDAKHRDLFRAPKEQFYNEATGDYEGRGNALMRLAYFGAEVGMSDEALFAVIIDADSRWGKFVDRKDRERRYIEFIKKVREKYPSKVFTVEQSTEEITRLWGFRDFLNSKITFKWLVKDLIPQQSINFITATPGVGKSRFVLQFGAALALGEQFLRWNVVGGKKKVVFFSLEMGAPVLKKFVGDLARAGDFDLDSLNEQFKLIPAGEPLDLASSEGEGFMKYVLDEEKPDVVIIDAMGSLSYEDLTEKAAKTIMNKLKGWLNEYGTTFYIVHHNRKPNAISGDKPPTLADFYGNTYGATDAASILGLWRNPKTSGQLEIHTLKSRTGASHRPVILRDSPDRFTFSVMEQEEIDDHYSNAATGTESHSPQRQSVRNRNGAEGENPIFGLFSSTMD